MSRFVPADEFVAFDEEEPDDGLGLLAPPCCPAGAPNGSSTRYVVRTWVVCVNTVRYGYGAVFSYPAAAQAPQDSCGFGWPSSI